METPSTAFAQTVDSAGSAQQSKLTGFKWDGSRVFEFTGRVHSLYGQLPVFSRHPFRIGSEENRFKDEIRREPMRIDEDPLPITTVSKGYSLVQHRDVLSAVFRALRMIQIDISELDSRLLISEYGERMQWSCTVPGFGFDPGDRNPIVLQINCMNSVDTSTVLEICFGWYRLVCGNGMMYGFTNSQIRRRHITTLDPRGIAATLADHLQCIDTEQNLYKRWLEHAVSPDRLCTWVNEDVARAWGPHAAARTWSIATTGFDGEVQQANKVKPHEMRVNATTQVPGSGAPIDNLFHAAQALSWVAGTRPSFGERLEYVRQIPKLLEPLENLSPER